MRAMDLKNRWKTFVADERVRFALFLIGCGLIVLAPIAGLLPGPGGLIVFAVGAGMALRYSKWAKKRYVAFKKRHPRYGGWADWSLRRESAKRRVAISKRKAADSD